MIRLLGLTIPSTSIFVDSITDIGGMWPGQLRVLYFYGRLGLTNQLLKDSLFSVKIPTNLIFDGLLSRMGHFIRGKPLYILLLSLNFLRVYIVGCL